LFSDNITSIPASDELQLMPETIPLPDASHDNQAVTSAVITSVDCRVSAVDTATVNHDIDSGNTDGTLGCSSSLNVITNACRRRSRKSVAVTCGSHPTDTVAAADTVATGNGEDQQQIVYAVLSFIITKY
jgi:hypothetical protein